jgi:hypothetical protein
MYSKYAYKKSYEKFKVFVKLLQPRCKAGEIFFLWVIWKILNNEDKTANFLRKSNKLDEGIFQASPLKYI